MTKIIDINGNPIDQGALKEPQTARVAMLANTFVESNVDGLTPARAARILREADAGNIRSQHILFDDINDRDIHVRGEFGKRQSVVADLDWDIVPPQDASAEEKALAEWVKATLLNAVDDFEDLLLYSMEAVGHGFAPVELEWFRDDGEWLPRFHHRPQTWFRLDRTRRELRLDDASADGAVPTPFGWIIHRPNKVKTGYQGRAGLFRSLVWPFLYRAYSVGDFAEFLEVYGLPIIVGKYFAGASPDEKASLMRAVTQLGHDARAIMPAEMELEIKQVTGSGGGSHHMTMVEWAEKAITRGILGGTLTSGADGKSSTNALGNVHNEVRHDIRDGDASSLGATLTRDLVYPLIVLNKGGLSSLRRCPRLVFDTGEAEDIQIYSEALPKLATLLNIPASWARTKLRIPVAKDGEEILRAPQPPAPVETQNIASQPSVPPATAKALLTASLSADNPPDFPDQVNLDAAIDALPIDALQGMAQSALQPVIELLSAGNHEDAANRLAELFPAMNTAALETLLARCCFAAETWGRLSAREESGDA